MKISASIYSDKKRPLKEVIEDLVQHQVELLHVDCNDDLSVFEDIKLIRQWCDLPVEYTIFSANVKGRPKVLRAASIRAGMFSYTFLIISMSNAIGLSVKLFVINV